MEIVQFIDLGLTDYKEAWDYQTAKHKELVDRKMRNRNQAKQGLTLEKQLHYLVFCEHPPVYTLGKSGSVDNLLLNAPQLEDQGFQFYKINRGGDITYHGPGQIVGYPIFDLEHFFTDVHKYVRFLEEAVIRTLAHYGLEGIRVKGFTGVWLPEQGYLPKRKICAIGVHLSRWVTMHGFAFNINTQINHFDNIIPCGIVDKDKAVTTLEREIGKKIDIDKVKTILKKQFADLFQFDWTESD